MTDMLADDGALPLPAVVPHLTLFVPGTPAPQGSMKGFKVGGAVRVVASSGEKLGAWRSAVSRALDDTYDGDPLDVPVEVEVAFVLARPKSAPKSRTYPDRTPDVDKLARAVLDCLTGIVVTDDARVVTLAVTKRYGARPGALIVVRVAR